MKSSRSNNLETLERWAISFDVPRGRLSPEEMALVRNEVLQRLASYRLALWQKYKLPPENIGSSWRCLESTVPRWLVSRIREVDYALREISHADCPESAIVEMNSLAGLSGDELEHRLRVITWRLDAEAPERQERAKFWPLMKRMLNIVGHPNCPESVIEEFLALMNTDKRNLFAALESLLCWRENAIVQTAQVLQKAKSGESVGRQVEQVHQKQDKKLLTRMSTLVKRRDEWMKGHGFTSLSMAELDPIPTAELLHQWNDGNNAFCEDDREVIWLSLRKHVGIGGIPMARFAVCPKCSLVGKACTCNNQA